MPFCLQQSSDTRVLTLSGEITVTCAAELHRVLLDALASDEPLVVDLREVSAVDASAVQLLVAARRTGRPLSLAAPLPPSLTEWFRLAGVAPFPTSALIEPRVPTAAPPRSGNAP
jgi:anti-anti-sigma factor